MRLAAPPPSHCQKPHSPFGNNTLGNLVCLMSNIDRLTAVCVVPIQQNQNESSFYFKNYLVIQLTSRGNEKVLKETTNLYYYYRIIYTIIPVMRLFFIRVKVEMHNTQ